MGLRTEAGVTARGIGIQIDFRWKGIRCRETLKLDSSKKPNMQYAARLRAEILRKIELGTFIYGDYFPDSPRANIYQKKIPTLKEAAATYFKSHKSQLANSTYITYEKNLNKHWLPAFGDRRLDTITYSDLMECLSTMAVAPKSRNCILIPMRRILDTAFIDGVIPVNPAGRVRNVKAQKPQPDPFTPEEAELILDHMASKYNEQIVNYFEFAFYSGLRTSELIELQWADIEEDVAIIRRARVEGVSKATKTSQVRIIELNARAKEALLRQKSHTKLTGKHVFLNPFTNEPWNDQRSQAKIYWQPTLTKLKLHYRTPYQTRHTFATMMLMADANPMWVSRQLGHANMKMTLEVYSKWIDLADKSRELEKVNSRLLVTKRPQKKTGTSET